MSLATLDWDLRTHVIEGICAHVRETPVMLEPFPHFQVRNFFPEDVYATLQKMFPAQEAFEAFSYEKHHNADGDSNRRRLKTSNESLERLPAKQQRFWQTVRSALGSREVKSEVFQKLSPGLCFRYGIDPSALAALPGYALPELFYETGGYSIKPHPDTRRKVVTMQISLSADDKQAHMGTEFYTRSLRPTAWLRAPHGFDIAKQMPFLPNAAYAFVVLNTTTLKSWHGRTKIDETSGSRRSLLNIWYAKPEDACLDTHQENQEIYADKPALSAPQQAA